MQVSKKLRYEYIFNPSYNKSDELNNNVPLLHELHTTFIDVVCKQILTSSMGRLNMREHKRSIHLIYSFFFL